MGKRGRPASAESDEDRCQAQTLPTEWKAKNSVSLRCPFIAKVLINHVQLCHKHAELEALAILIERAEATVIFKAPRSPYQHIRIFQEKP